MHVRHLAVADFRSWRSADLALQPGSVVLVGANGQGKTNLVEAIGYLATLGSHRVAHDAPLIRAGAQRAVVRAAVVADGRELRVEVEITAGKANRARLNGAPVPRPREILGVLRTVLFAPEDLAIVRGDPGERRRFLDEVVVARIPRLAGVRADYERVLRQRATLLKSAGGARRRAGSAGTAGPGSAELATLDVWDAQLAEHGSQLLHARLEAVRALRPHAALAYAQVAPTSVGLRLRYVTALAELLPALDDPEQVPEQSDLVTAMLTQMQQVRTAEIDRGVNLVGPHRDDLDLRLGELPVRGYASHGESWSAALSLRLGSYELLRADTLPGGDPILILDDVFAELDVDRRAQLAVVAAQAEQVIVTAAVLGDVPAELRGARFMIADGGIDHAD